MYYLPQCEKTRLEKVEYQKYIAQFMAQFLKWGLDKYQQCIDTDGYFLDDPIPREWLPGFENIISRIENNLEEYSGYIDVSDSMARHKFPEFGKSTIIDDVTLIENITHLFCLTAISSSSLDNIFNLNGFITSPARYSYATYYSNADLLGISAYKLSHDTGVNDSFATYRSKAIEMFTNDPNRLKRILAACVSILPYRIYLDDFINTNNEIRWEKVFEQLTDAFNNIHIYVARRLKRYIDWCIQCFNGELPVEEMVDQFLLDVFINIPMFPQSCTISYQFKNTEFGSFRSLWEYYLPIILQLVLNPFDTIDANELKEYLFSSDSDYIDSDKFKIHNDVLYTINAFSKAFSNTDSNGRVIGNAAYFLVDNDVVKDLNIYDILKLSNDIFKPKIESLSSLVSTSRFFYDNDNSSVLHTVITLMKTPIGSLRRSESLVKQYIESVDGDKVIDFIVAKTGATGFKNVINEIKALKDIPYVSYDTILLRRNLPVEGVWTNEYINHQTFEHLILKNDVSKILKPKEHIENLKALGFIIGDLPKKMKNVISIPGSIPPGWILCHHDYINGIIPFEKYKPLPKGIYLIDQNDIIRGRFNFSSDCYSEYSLKHKLSIEMFPRYMALCTTSNESESSIIFDLKEAKRIKLFRFDRYEDEIPDDIPNQSYTLHLAQQTIKEMYPDMFSGDCLQWWKYW